MGKQLDRHSFRKMAEAAQAENDPASDLLMAYADAWEGEVDVHWKARFMWLWRNATDGFGTPEGWWAPLPDAPSEKDLADIDKWIAEEK